MEPLSEGGSGQREVQAQADKHSIVRRRSAAVGGFERRQLCRGLQRVALGNILDSWIQKPEQTAGIRIGASVDPVLTLSEEVAVERRVDEAWVAGSDLKGPQTVLN